MLYNIKYILTYLFRPGLIGVNRIKLWNRFYIKIYAVIRIFLIN
jgi:hypothetical protein